jgi:alpha 1,3-mannosyltransferase
MARGMLLQYRCRRSTWIVLIIILTYTLSISLKLGARPISVALTFDDHLHNLLGLLPDEQSTSRLLSPIDHSSGESMLRDLATRTRVFSQIFNAWEDVHPADTDASMNIITIVRQRFPHSADQLINDYDKMRCFFNRLTQHLFPWTMAYFADHSLLHASFRVGGRGIVMSVSDRQVSYAVTTITALRRLGCELPVEVFYLGEEDLHMSSRSALSRVPGVITRDLSQMVYDEGWTIRGIPFFLLFTTSLNYAGWAAKPWAMLFSSFEEAILIDADAIFFKNPADLFATPEYKQYGALFFRDRLLSPSSRREFLEKTLPLPMSPNVMLSNRWWLGTSGHMQESGVVVVDKWRHFVALLLATRLNGPERNGRPGESGVYQMMHGDKETFWLSWEMSGDIDYAFYQGRAGQIGHFVQDPFKSGGEICGIQLLHLNLEGRPLWFNGGIAENKNHDDHLTNFQKFHGFISEPKEATSTSITPWDGWEERDDGSIMCLHDDTFTPLSRKEQEIIDMTTDIARKWSN